jgi:hypothetical protein
MKRTFYDGKLYIISRFRNGKTELVDVSNGKLRVVSGEVTSTLTKTQTLITGMAKFLDRPRSFLQDLRRRRVDAARKPGPSKARKKREDSGDDSNTTSAIRKRKESPSGGRKSRKAKGPSYPSPDEIIRLKMMPKEMRATIMSTLGYSELPGMFD